MKTNKISNLTQHVAAKILSSFVFCSSAEDVKRVTEKVMAEYGLCKEPFSGFPCTPKDYRKNQCNNSNEHCVICGAAIPEGRQVCPSCCERYGVLSK